MSNDSEDNKGLNPNVLSPVLTAQDRKKRIKQRRSVLQRSQSLPLNNTSRSVHGNNKSHGDDNVSNLSKLDSHIIRRRNYGSKPFSSSLSQQLFNDDDQVTITRTDSQANVKTRLFSSDSKSDAIELDEKIIDNSPRKKGSLFGQVMERTGTIDSVTPVKKRSKLEKPTTPAQRLNRQLLSPGGFTMLQMLNNVTSPFTGKKSPADEEKPEQGLDNESSSAVKESNEWKEAPIDEILDWSIKQNLCLECHPPNCLPDSTSDYLDEWRTALQYWQYPAKPFLKESTTAFEKDKALSNFSTIQKKIGVEAPSAIARKLIDAVRGPNAYVHKLLRFEEDLADLRHFREYQDAFSSLYDLWIKQIENGDKKAYFYGISMDQITLFRPQITEEELLPSISFSTLTMVNRKKLMDIGLKLYLPNGGIFCESLFEDAQIEEEKATNKPDDTLVKTDMEALRKAQAWGEIAGADVTVKTKTKRKYRFSANIPSLYISGYDDCASYFTMLLNRDYSTDSNYPIFLSRIGAFRNATLMSLVPQRRRIQDDIGHIELRGPILPCAATAIMQAAARNMNKNNQSSGRDNSDVLNNNGLGSHYFVVQTELKGKKDSYSWGSQCQLSNSRKCCIPDQQVGSPNESGIQQVADVFVWDISRPDVATVKFNVESSVV
eukprot:CAMPEP_0194222356 /NCGR_PEP_ID=MMETSP0156-20130528/32766_1 /TAXON_ID=33649 /ORGANISM="Thalassionema nitzschioides, Strain L26-B" /LENGTH=660 /DNA_ID=CAMNT_0038953119 /DNA_START=49 /DNA_END=2031 /DNA_ORIENTATION=-